MRRASGELGGFVLMARSAVGKAKRRDQQQLISRMSA